MAQRHSQLRAQTVHQRPSMNSPGASRQMQSVKPAPPKAHHHPQKIRPFLPAVVIHFARIIPATSVPYVPTPCFADNFRLPAHNRNGSPSIHRLPPEQERRTRNSAQPCTHAHEKTLNCGKYAQISSTKNPPGDAMKRLPQVPSISRPCQRMEYGRRNPWPKTSCPSLSFWSSTIRSPACAAH